MKGGGKILDASRRSVGETFWTSSEGEAKNFRLFLFNVFHVIGYLVFGALFLFWSRGVENF